MHWLNVHRRYRRYRILNRARVRGVADCGARRIVCDGGHSHGGAEDRSRGRRHGRGGCRRRRGAAGGRRARPARAVHGRTGQGRRRRPRPPRRAVAVPQLSPGVGAAALPRGAVCQRQRRRRARHPQRSGARRRRPGLDRLRRDPARLVRRQRAQLRRRHATARGRRADRGDRRRAGGGHRRGAARQHARRHRVTRSRRPPAARATACWPTTADTASAAPCTRIRTCRTKVAPARACGCGRGW